MHLIWHKDYFFRIPNRNLKFRNKSWDMRSNLVICRGFEWNIWRGFLIKAIVSFRWIRFLITNSHRQKQIEHFDLWFWYGIYKELKKPNFLHKFAAESLSQQCLNCWYQQAKSARVLLQEKTSASKNRIDFLDLNMAEILRELIMSKFRFIFTAGYLLFQKWELEKSVIVKDSLF